MHPLSPSHAGPAVPCTWLTDRLPLLHRVTGRFQTIWALHAAGHPDDSVAAHLQVPSATVTSAVRSLYRALAIDPDDGELARVQAAQLYRALSATRTGRPSDQS
ncbi:hypothetical protein E7T09_12550 [Deinococcus sp. KSM4-11]|uniref:hypothetical protein n=1 Tax=Deinococcus sp. KSM4-11 TaxID=2568654 RepID=UPI0010A428EE|nr:hypothetical protein [Deinococcus sp. KSM4-11]THF86066.1 hypothetical protein E7T09_12550 [Deinococcus sp. KSM4-11]